MRTPNRQDLDHIVKLIQNLPENKEVYVGLWLGVANALASAFTFGFPPRGAVNGALTLAGFMRLAETRRYWEQRAIGYKEGKYQLPENDEGEQAHQVGVELSAHLLPLIAGYMYKGYTGFHQVALFSMCSFEMVLPLASQYQLSQFRRMNPDFDAIVQHETYQDKHSAHNWFNNVSLAGVAVIFLYALYDFLQRGATDEDIFFFFTIASHLLNNVIIEKQLPTFSRNPAAEATTSPVMVSTATAPLTPPPSQHRLEITQLDDNELNLEESAVGLRRRAGHTPV